MTEQDWLEGENPAGMVNFLQKRRVGDRKLRLFGCACCRRVWPLLPDDASRAAVEVAERYADKFARRKDLNAAHLACGGDTPLHRNNPAGTVVRVSLKMAAFWTAYNARCTAAGTGPFDASQIAERTAIEVCEGMEQAKLLHDIFGNPFRPVTMNPSWLTPAVTSLATASYQERSLPSGELDRARLSILADALEEAGCDNEEILCHLRQEGAAHYRGCWALDLLLNKG